VKCDSVTPACDRCTRDDIVCPGYTKKLKWNQYRPGAPKRKRPSAKVSQARKPATASESSTEKGSIQSSPDVTDELSVSALTFPESLEDRENRLLVECSDFFNTHMLPTMIPAYRPFKREEHVAHHWTFIPRVLRNVMLLFVRTAQERHAKNDTTPSLELCHFRGQSLTDLRCSIPEAASDPFGIVLAGVLTLTGIELSNPSFGEHAWKYHFDAARRIIQLRGGFGKCFFSLPHSEGILIKYMILDIFTSTTCHVSALTRTNVHDQTSYIPIVLLRERFLIENGHLCPQQLLRAIIRTTNLRVVSQKPTSNRGSIFYPDSTFEGIRTDMLAFDAQAWAEKVSRYGIALPATVEDAPSSAAIGSWVLVAESYRYAALLYLLLSIRAPSTTEELEHIGKLHGLLSTYVKGLFSMGSPDPDGSIETQLWKFTTWPAFVSTYVGICWSCSDAHALENDLQQVREAAEVLKSPTLLRGVDFMNGVAEKRAEDFGALWKWSDGFPARCAFAVC
jgi:hypothetical protein